MSSYIDHVAFSQRSDVSRHQQLVISLGYWSIDVSKLIAGFIGYTDDEKHKLWREHQREQYLAGLEKRRAEAEKEQHAHEERITAARMAKRAELIFFATLMALIGFAAGKKIATSRGSQ